MDFNNISEHCEYRSCDSKIFESILDGSKKAFYNSDRVYGYNIGDYIIFYELNDFMSSNSMSNRKLLARITYVETLSYGGQLYSYEILEGEGI